MESAAEPDMGSLDLGRQGRQQTREEGEARVLVVGSGMGVSSLPGMDQSQGPVFVNVSPGLCTSLAFPSPSFHSCPGLSAF